MRISDWSSDVCSSDLSGSWQRNIVQPAHRGDQFGLVEVCGRMPGAERPRHDIDVIFLAHGFEPRDLLRAPSGRIAVEKAADHIVGLARAAMPGAEFQAFRAVLHGGPFNRGSDEAETRSAEHTSELQLLMRISYAVFC